MKTWTVTTTQGIEVDVKADTWETVDGMLILKRVLDEGETGEPGVGLFSAHSWISCIQSES